MPHPNPTAAPQNHPMRDTLTAYAWCAALGGFGGIIAWLIDWSSM